MKPVKDTPIILFWVLIVAAFALILCSCSTTHKSKWYEKNTGNQTTKTTTRTDSTATKDSIHVTTDRSLRTVTTDGITTTETVVEFDTLVVQQGWWLSNGSNRNQDGVTDTIIYISDHTGQDYLQKREYSVKSDGKGGLNFIGNGVFYNGTNFVTVQPPIRRITTRTTSTLHTTDTHQANTKDSTALHTTSHVAGSTYTFGHNEWTSVRKGKEVQRTSYIVAFSMIAAIGIIWFILWRRKKAIDKAKDLMV